MTKSAKPSKPSARGVRGPHAERTAAMRQRLIEAAIACLYERGYAATTFQVVTERAEVSRGAILHHFPTKVDLMVAVAEYAAFYQNRVIRERLADTPAGMPLYVALTYATWEIVIQPPAMALIEVMMATRADSALAERLPAVVTAFEARQREDVWRLAQRIGIRDREQVDTMVRLHRAAMRGLAIELSLTGDRAAAEASMRLLERYKRMLTGELVTAVD
ncbi:TetR/AcrR family transcriptional regulator [Phenylobacterium sp.]|uniref:TetR/AcrR family transcriptional regulator n=1 Tax=Phenylobacterium sp. TaxID=1871053 RepID=UPI0035AEBBA8